MRILHLIWTLSPAGGGPPNVASRIAAAQAAAGHEVHLLTYAGADEDDVRRAVESIPAFGRIVTHLIPSPTLPQALLGRAPALLREQVRLAQAVHMHGVWEPMLYAASAVARRHGVPYAVRPAGMLDPWSLRQKRLKKRVAMALHVRRMLNGAAFLHALNADEEDLLAPLRLRCPVEVIPNGVFLEEIDPLPPPGTFRAAHPELAGDPFVLFLSRLHYKKGLDYLADAFALLARRHPAVRLVVAGPDDGARGPFEQAVRAAGLESRVHLVGPLYGRDKFAALVDAACFCLPSRQEGFSVAVTEALACGVPAVISQECHFPEVAQAAAGEVVPLDAARVAEALGRVLSDDALRARMGAAGKELVRSRYIWPRIAERCVEAYHRHGKSHDRAPAGGGSV